jgi:hypothetical protein
MNNQQLRDRFGGGLVGVSVGDAVGAGYEGLRTVQPADRQWLERRPGAASAAVSAFTRAAASAMRAALVWA